MKVFVTGATGFVGEAVVRELITAGHAVLGLARSDEAAAELTQVGATPVRATLDDLDVLTRSAAACDAIAHLAMNRPERNAQYRMDPEAYKKNNAMDRAAIEALVAAKRPLIVTSGTGIARANATEDDPPTPDGLGAIRGPAEELALAGGATVLRLPASVHGVGDRGFVPGLIAVAKKLGFAGYVGDGSSRWPAVHKADAARLYRLALETPAKVAGKRLHGAAEEGVAMRAIASAIGEGLGLPVRSISADEAAEGFGWLARFVGMDLPVSSAKTRTLLGWEPRELGLLEDMKASYFESK